MMMKNMQEEIKVGDIVQFLTGIGIHAEHNKEYDYVCANRDSMVANPLTEGLAEDESYGIIKEYIKEKFPDLWIDWSSKTDDILYLATYIR